MPEDTPSHPPPHCSRCGGALLGSVLGAQCPRCALALAAEPADVDDAELGSLFPELKIVGKIARGGFGTVYRAEHKKLQRPVALKFLDPHLARSREAVARFEKEMAAVGQLDHAGIVRAHDAGEREGHWFIVMEFVEGEDLATLSRRRGPLPPSDAARLVRQAALALAYAHERGLVHRDVKPSNIMVASGAAGAEMVALSPVKVLDFGLAGLAREAESVFRGTPDYAAPEQFATPGDVDARADIFGLGATLFRLLTGQAPQARGGDESIAARIQRVATEPAPPVATLRPAVPARLAELCDRMLALDRTARPATALEVADLLAPFAGEKKRAPAAWWPPVVAAVLLSLGAYFFGREKGAPLLNADEAHALALDAAATPRIYTRDWTLEAVLVCDRNHRTVQFLPDDALLAVAFRDAPGVQATRWASGASTPLEALGSRLTSWRAYGAPGGGFVATDPNFRPNRLLRFTAEGTAQPPLPYADGRYSSIESIAFVAAPPPGTPLRAGDLLVADAGRGDWLGRGSLWRGRLDDDAPLQLLAEDAILSAPVDVAIGRAGVFVFNRNAGYAATRTAATDADTAQRVIRWDGTHFHPCRVSQPIRDPSGFVADPQSDAFFAAEGSSLSGGGPAQRLLRLTPGKKADTFEVEVLADRFGQLAAGALAINADGTRLALADNALARIFVLRRR